MQNMHAPVDSFTPSRLPEQVLGSLWPWFWEDGLPGDSMSLDLMYAETVAGYLGLSVDEAFDLLQSPGARTAAERMVHCRNHAPEGGHLSAALNLAMQIKAGSLPIGSIACTLRSMGLEA